MGEDEEEEVERLQAARAQCLYLIFGVDFEERDAEWGSSTKVLQILELLVAILTKIAAAFHCHNACVWEAHVGKGLQQTHSGGK